MKEGSIYTLYFIVVMLLASACTKNQNQSNRPTAAIEPYLDLALTDAERDSLQGGLEDHQKAFQEKVDGPGEKEDVCSRHSLTGNPVYH